MPRWSPAWREKYARPSSSKSRSGSTPSPAIRTGSDNSARPAASDAAAGLGYRVDRPGPGIGQTIAGSLAEADWSIQLRVFSSTATLLNLEVDMLFFDTTTSFETEVTNEEVEGLRRCRRPSKDHRPELPPVVIGLAVTRSGVPVRCRVWPGNTADASVVDEVRRDLAGYPLSRVVWVMDRGTSVESKRVALQRGGGHAIVGG